MQDGDVMDKPVYFLSQCARFAVKMALFLVVRVGIICPAGDCGTCVTREMTVSIRTTYTRPNFY